jgi:hypothetical protein
MTPDLPGWTGGWLLPVVCTDRGRHPMVLICHAYEHEVFGTAYTAPPGRVRQTRANLGIPGWSRESVRLFCGTCTRTPSVDRRRWGQVLDQARHAEVQWLDVSGLDT